MINNCLRPYKNHNFILSLYHYLVVKGVCIDNSFLIGLLTQEGKTRIFQQYWQRWNTLDLAIIAPRLIYYEASNVFYRLERLSQIHSALDKLNIAFELKIVTYHDFELHQAALVIAKKFNLPAAYDAHYLALAARFDVDFFTCDKKLYNTIQGKFPRINLITTDTT